MSQGAIPAAVEAQDQAGVVWPQARSAGACGGHAPATSLGVRHMVAAPRRLAVEIADWSAGHTQGPSHAWPRLISIGPSLPDQSLRRYCLKPRSDHRYGRRASRRAPTPRDGLDLVESTGQSAGTPDGWQPAVDTVPSLEKGDVLRGEFAYAICWTGGASRLRAETPDATPSSHGAACQVGDDGA